MNDAEFAAIEEYLGYALPVQYRDVMRTYPFDRRDPNLRIALLADLEDILAWNMDLYEGEWADEWRKEWFAIGNSPCGDLYFFDVGNGSPVVWVWDHETHGVSEESPDLESFILAQEQGVASAKRELARQNEERRREESERMRHAGRIIWRGFLFVIVLPIVLMILWVWWRTRR